MKTAAKSIESLEAWLPQTAPGSQTVEPDWLTSERQSALQRLRSEPLPGRKQEIWRYSNPGSLLEQELTAVEDGELSFTEQQLQQYLIPELDAWRLVLVNGHMAPGLCQLDGLPEGVQISSLQQMLREQPQLLAQHFNRIAGQGAHLFAALNTAGMHDGLVVHLAEGCQLQRPIELIQLSLSGDQPRLIQPRHLVILEQNARLTLLERYLGPESSIYCTNNLMEVHLGEQAHLEHHRLQEESPHAFHLTGLYLRQSADSRYSGSNVALGAGWSRTDLKVNFQSAGAECDINGLYLAGDGQMVDFHLDVEHGVPGCASRQHFKGLLNGKGRAVLDGRIHVAKDAQKTDAHLKNANLLLSRQAEVDTKPQLEILADDVKCSHGATVGQIDPNSLFYLRSRGIPEAEAKRMLCIGFAGEIIQGCGPEALQQYIESRVVARLS